MNAGPNPASYLVDLGALPSWVQMLHFTANIAGSGAMGQIRSCTARIKQNNKVAFELKLSGSDFSTQKVLIVLQIYKKDEWRVSAIAAGFEGGLAKLCENYGIAVDDDSEPVEQPQRQQKRPQPREQTKPAAEENYVEVAIDKDDDDFERSDNDWV